MYFWINYDSVLMFKYMFCIAPLKGIPSRIPSGGFRTSVLSSNISRPNPARPLSGRKDCAIKLLDITEQPLGYAQAKKRKRMLGEHNFINNNMRKEN